MKHLNNQYCRFPGEALYLKGNSQNSTIRLHHFQYLLHYYFIPGAGIKRTN